MRKYTNLIALKIITYTIIIAMAALPIISRLEGKKSEGWYSSLLFLGCSLAIIYTTIKSFDDRLKKIEKQLKLEETSKESSDDRHD